MPINVVLSSYTVGQLSDGIRERKIRINYDYQRSPKVWPQPARSFLVETVLLGYPIPKLFFQQITDIKAKTTIMEIVDGQQRTATLLAYLSDEFALSPSGAPDEAAGRKFSELPDDLKARFVSYGLATDLLISSSREEIREVFRRINSYTAPLNAEEKRHARFQGEFKWFVHRLSQQYGEVLGELGVLTEKQLNRMQDAKLLTEIIHAIEHGITTTRETALSRMYEDFENGYPNEAEVEERLQEALDVVLRIEELRGSSLMKPYHFYSLILAITHSQMAVDRLRVDFDQRPLAEEAAIRRGLLRLASAAEDPGLEPELEAFSAASSKKTNVADHRRVRFLWCSRAVTGALA